MEQVVTAEEVVPAMGVALESQHHWMQRSAPIRSQQLHSRCIGPTQSIQCIPLQNTFCMCTRVVQSSLLVVNCTCAERARRRYSRPAECFVVACEGASSHVLAAWQRAHKQAARQACARRLRQARQEGVPRPGVQLRNPALAGGICAMKALTSRLLLRENAPTTTPSRVPHERGRRNLGRGGGRPDRGSGGLRL